MRIELHLGDITKLNVDCIVNAARPSLLGGGGVDGAIHAAAGSELKDYCRGLKGCGVGEVVLTPAFNLPVKAIIHTVGPRYLFGNEKEKQGLVSCYTSSLVIAQREQFGSIAFPNISTGVYGYPKDLAADIAFSTTVDFLSRNEYPDRVVFCCFDNESFQLYTALLNSHPNTTL